MACWAAAWESESLCVDVSVVVDGEYGAWREVERDVRIAIVSQMEFYLDDNDYNNNSGPYGAATQALTH